VSIPTAPITRPNGKIYRPRKVVCHSWENDPGFEEGVVILGTHDVEACRAFATEMVQYWIKGEVADNPRVGWFRDGFESGRRMWVDDPVRGAAGVMWDGVSP
jgi:hypothetical protein